MAEKIKFTKDYDAPVPHKRAHIAYKAGKTYVVPQWVADLAVENKVGHVIEDRSKKSQ